MTNSLPVSNWRLTIEAIDEAPAEFADRLHPSLGIADKMDGHLDDRRRLMQKRLEVVNDPADRLTVTEAARLLLKAKVRMFKIRMYSRIDDAEVNRLPMDTAGWTVLRYTATSRTGEKVTADLMLIIDTREDGEQIVTSKLI